MQTFSPYSPVPKVEVMDCRMGNLAEEFKQLVYPPGYDPDGKTTKRKQGKIATEPKERGSYILQVHFLLYHTRLWLDYHGLGRSLS